MAAKRAQRRGPRQNKRRAVPQATEISAGARRAGGALVLLLATFVAYAPALGAGFIWDDDEYVLGNPQLRDAAGLARIWLEPGATPQYYPLVFTTFWLERRAWGLDPAGYHAVNILLHALAAILLWRVLRRMAVPGAWLAGALFALHPVHVESVAWITERKNTLSAVFFLLALLAYLRFRPRLAADRDAAAPARGPTSAYLLSLGLFAAALLSKTVTCALPAVILVLEWWRHGRLERRAVLPTVPMFALGGALAAVTVTMERVQVGAAGAAWDLSFVERCLIAGRALLFYAGKLLWPHPLIFVYPRWTIDAGAAWQYLFPLAAAAVVVALFLLRRRLGRGPLAAVLLFAGMLVPALGFFDVYPMLFSFVADHFQYLASTALLALFAAGGARMASRDATLRRWLRPLAALVLLALGALTWQQARVYRDLETLWRDTLAKNPGAWMAHTNLGWLLYERDRLDEAGEHFRQAIALHPDNAAAHYDLGLVLGRQGRHAEAERHFREALRLDPEHARAHNNLGTALVDRGRFEEAVEHFRLAARHGEGYALAYANLGDTLLRLGRDTEAVEAYRQALRLEPGDRTTRSRLSVVLERAGAYGEAIATVRALLATEPDDAVALGRLARLLATAPGVQRDPAEAVRLAERACALTAHRNAALLGTLATAYTAAGRRADAERALGQAITRASAEERPRMAELLRRQLRQLEVARTSP